tara:strand:+ start:3749 stop:4921 length:1173 start_codon:yes stop_codon:yes gene_type:complete
MSSIIKVDTIQDVDGNVIISKSTGGGIQGVYPSSTAPIVFTVTVASKTSDHPYNGVGSGNAYLINGLQAPKIQLNGFDTDKPYYYKFDQSDNTNDGHPLRFYIDPGKNTQYTTNVTTSGVPGNSGAHTTIAVDRNTPNVLYYQCSAHGYMGNYVALTSPVLNLGARTIAFPSTAGSANQVLQTDGAGQLSFGDAVTFPTISSISPSVTDNTQTAITLTGTNFKDSSSPPAVEAQNSSTGAIVVADSVSFTNTTTVVATFTISVDGTYFLRLENNDGLAARTATALLTISDAPAWVTGSGSLGTVANGGTFNFTLTATDAVSFARTSGTLPGGATLNTGVGSATITGTETGSTETTTSSFTITATDAEGQTASRAFTITVSHGASGGGQFN